MAVSFLKKGSEFKQQLEKADAEAEARKAEQNLLWRFFLKKGTEADVTFVDGFLTSEGNLDVVTYHEHMCFIGGKWTPFVCIGEQEVCPICEGGDRSSFVGVLTVIDHSVYKYTDKEGVERIVKDRKKLFVAKKDTLKILQKAATKRGGLAGCRYTIGREGEKSPSVGNNFEFVNKRTIEECKADPAFLQAYEKIDPNDPQKKKKVKVQEMIFSPANYEKEIIYRDRKELLKLGFGGGKPIGGEPSAVGQKAVETGNGNLDDQL